MRLLITAHSLAHFHQNRVQNFIRLITAPVLLMRSLRKHRDYTNLQLSLQINKQQATCVTRANVQLASTLRQLNLTESCFRNIKVDLLSFHVLAGCLLCAQISTWTRYHLVLALGLAPARTPDFNDMMSCSRGNVWILCHCKLQKIKRSNQLSIRPLFGFSSIIFSTFVCLLFPLYKLFFFCLLA